MTTCCLKFGSACAAGIVLLLILFLSIPAAAQPSTIERQVKGKPDTNINAGIFTTVRRDCTAGPLPAVRLLSPPAHGTVSLKQGRIRATNLRPCLGLDLPAFVAFYRSARDFVGQDRFTIEVIATDGKVQIQNVTVTIAGADPGERL